jgi:hypothetical protein
MKRLIPLFVTAFAGAIPATDDSVVPSIYSADSERMESSPIRTSRVHPGLETWMSLVRTKANLAHLARDAQSHWRSIAVTGASARGRWEARRRGLMVQAWMGDHRASLSRLGRLTNPHHLSYLEICMEFDHRHLERIS